MTSSGTPDWLAGAVVARVGLDGGDLAGVVDRLTGVGGEGVTVLSLPPVFSSAAPGRMATLPGTVPVVPPSSAGWSLGLTFPPRSGIVLLG